MIVVDSSAVIAILRQEPDSHRLAHILTESDACVMSSVNFMETSIVVAGRGVLPDIFRNLDALMVEAEISIVVHDAALAYAAREAYLRYGKGRHPAALNLGDCAAYALAKTRGLPLLFKGQDFSKTDLVSAA